MDDNADKDDNVAIRNAIGILNEDCGIFFIFFRIIVLGLFDYLSSD